MTDLYKLDSNYKGMLEQEFANMEYETRKRVIFKLQKCKEVKI